jgi:hypothetical protein
MRRILATLIFINVAGLVAFAGMWAYASILAPMGSAGRVTQLDRAQVIDETKLAEFDPALATNVRHNLGAWIAEREHGAAAFSAVCGVLLCAANLTAILVAAANRNGTGQAEGPEQALSTTSSKA